MSGATVYTTIPAQPGFSIVNFLGGDDQHADELTFEPIIAWIVCRTEHDPSKDDGDDCAATVRPVTLEGTMYTSGYIGDVIKRPDGKYIAPHSQWFDDDAAVMAHLKGNK